MVWCFPCMYSMTQNISHNTVHKWQIFTSYNCRWCLNTRKTNMIQILSCGYIWMTQDILMMLSTHWRLRFLFLEVTVTSIYKKIWCGIFHACIRRLKIFHINGKFIWCVCHILSINDRFVRATIAVLNSR